MEATKTPRFAEDLGGETALARLSRGRSGRRLPRFTEILRRCTLLLSRVGIETSSR